MTASAVLTYLDIRGRAECIRLLLEEIGVAYEDRQITNAEWQDLKPRTPFGQLPLLRIGDIELAQTMAIVRHLARTHGLSGDTEAERTRCDIAVEAIRDADHHLGALVWTPGFEENRRLIVENELPVQLAPLERFLASNPARAPFWAGASLTFADVIAFDYLENTESLFPGALSGRQRLSEFRDQMTKRPTIKAYLESGRRPDAIMYGPRRDDGGDYSDPGPMNDSLRKIYPANSEESLNDRTHP
jgi:glutathione S-transferase